MAPKTKPTSRIVAAGEKPPRKPTPHGKRRSEAEVEATLSEVEALMDFGAGRSALLRAFPEIPSRTMDDYIARATKRIKEEATEQREDRRSRALRRNYGYLRDLHDPKNANMPGRYYAIARIEAHIARLEGTFTPEQVEIIKRKSWDDLDDSELEELKRTGRPPEGMTYADLDRLH